jgi:hypothetical protein
MGSQDVYHLNRDDLDQLQGLNTGDLLSKKEEFLYVLNQTDYSLLNIAQLDSVNIGFLGSLDAIENIDYNVNYTGGAGGKTKIILSNAIINNLTVGEKIYIKYKYKA